MKYDNFLVFSLVFLNSKFLYHSIVANYPLGDMVTSRLRANWEKMLDKYPEDFIRCLGRSNASMELGPSVSPCVSLIRSLT